MKRDYNFSEILSSCIASQDLEDLGSACYPGFFTFLNGMDYGGIFHDLDDCLFEDVFKLAAIICKLHCVFHLVESVFFEGYGRQCLCRKRFVDALPLIHPYRTETNMPHYTYQHTQQESEFTYILCGFYVPQLIQ